MRHNLFGIAIAVCALVAGPARAALTLQAAQSSYSTTPGGSLTLTIQLVETGGTTVLSSGGGLFSFGFALTRASGDATVTLAARNSAFDQLNPGSTTTFPATDLKLWAEQDANFGDTGPDAGSTVVDLATITINGGAGGGVFALADWNSLDQTVLYSGYALDSQISYGSFTIAIPEPAIGLWALPATALLLRRRHRPAASGSFYDAECAGG